MKIKKFNESAYLSNSELQKEPIKNETKTIYSFYITHKKRGINQYYFLKESDTLDGAIYIYNSLINDNLDETFYIEVEEIKTKKLTIEDFDLLINQKNITYEIYQKI